MSTITFNCPHCHHPGELPTPEDFAPRFVVCGHCNERFILERTVSGADVFREEEAPCCSNPECRSTELSLGDD